MKAIYLVAALTVSPIVAGSYFGDEDDTKSPDYETSTSKSITDHSKWKRGTGESTGAISFTSKGHQAEKKMWITSTGSTCNGTPKECNGGGR